jgi:phosphoglycerate dehydrogenase-like enzyme
MKTVYLNDHISQNAVNRLKQHVRLVDNLDNPEEIDAIIVRQQYATKEMIDKVKNCKLIQMHGVGLERIDLEAAKNAGIPVKNTPGGNAQSVAELSVGLMLALSRKINYIYDGMKQGKFTKFGLPETEGNEIYGKVLGLVGGGQIARLTAKIMTTAFAAKVLVYDPFLEAEKCKALGFEKIETLNELFSKSDFISIHVPLIDSTKHMITKEVLDSSKEGLILINTARGGIVDEKALYEALVTGKVKAAGMDVFEEQPPKADNPLFTLDNFIGTLHIGGSTAEALERNGQIVVDNIFEALGIEE